MVHEFLDTESLDITLLTSIDSPLLWQNLNTSEEPSKAKPEDLLYRQVSTGTLVETTLELQKFPDACTLDILKIPSLIRHTDVN